MFLFDWLIGQILFIGQTFPFTKATFRIKDYSLESFVISQIKTFITKPTKLKVLINSCENNTENFRRKSIKERTFHYRQSLALFYFMDIR